jgi:hypothetical protein
MIPNKLEDWTYTKVVELVENDINESERHDFKSDLPPPSELTKDCCAFANSSGGFIILGVKESGRGFRIEGVCRDKDLANRFGQKLHALPTNPHFNLAPFIPIPNSDKVLAVVEILKVSRGPYIPASKDQRIFWKRTNSGNEQMSYEEIEEAFRKYLKVPDYTKNEIRFRILFMLYVNHINGELGRKKITKEIIKQADLEYYNINYVNAEIIYLKDSGLISGMQPGGYSVPYALMITSKGIDRICKWFHELIEILSKESRADYNQIVAVSGNANKLSEFWRIFNQNENLRSTFFKENYLL